MTATAETLGELDADLLIGFCSNVIRCPTRGYLAGFPYRCIVDASNHPPYRRIPARASARTTVDHYARHVGKRVVLRMDLANFFGSIPVRRVAALFRGAGYPHQIALSLAHLSTDRKQFETLKAILTNCVRHRWEGQNRDSHPNFREHLRGRIEQHSQTNRQRYEKLIRLYNRIAW